MRSKAILGVFLVLFGFYSFAFGQAQTGSIRGLVVDESGDGLPGVTVTISSPNLMGKLSFLTSDKGEFRFPLCPPGEYAVKAEVQGFQPAENKGVIVNVGSTVDIRLALKSSEQNVEVAVTASAPVVDIRSSKIGVSITTDMVKNIPVKRDIADLVGVAPSVVPEETEPTFRKFVSIHGGALTQNAYAMDGVNITDPTRGYITKGVSFEAIEEVEMMTGGMSAEVGQAAGGYMNVVSKSGGNKFSGSATVLYNSKSLSSSTIPVAQLGAMGIPGVRLDKTFLDASASLGGPIIKDKLWFFVNGFVGKQVQESPFIPFTDPRGIFHDKYDAKRDSWMTFGKLTAQISSKLKFMGMWQYTNLNEDPNWNAISGRGAFSTYEAMTKQLDDSHTVSTVLTYLMGPSMFAELRGGFVYRYMDVPNLAEMRNDPTPAITDRLTSQRWGSYGNQELHHRYKWNGGLNITKFIDNFLGGNHELKVGAEYGYWYTEDDRGLKQPYAWGYFNGTPWYYNDTRPYVGRITIKTNPPRGSMFSRNESRRISAFLQDNMSIGKRLTLNLGVRYDTEHATRPEEIRKGYVDPYYNGLSNVLLPDLFSTHDLIAPEIKDFFVLSLLQPRIGMSYDLFGNGKTALKASFSRYGSTILAQDYGEIHPFLQSVQFRWSDLNKNGELDLPPTDTYSASSVPRLLLDPEEMRKTVNQKAKAPYVDEFIVGIQQEVLKNVSLSTNFIYKEDKNLIEYLDLANPLGGDMWLPYTTKEPGDDGKFGTGDDRDITVFALKDSAESPLLYRTNTPQLKRKYWGVEFILFKRMSNNWQFSGSAVFSKQYGNIGSNSYNTTGQEGFLTDPNYLINRWGRQNWDRPVQVKLMGTYSLPYGINLSAFYRFMSGAPMSEGTVSGGQIPFNRTVTIYFPDTIDGFAVRDPSVTVFAEPSGSKRNSPTSILDLRLEKTLRVPYGTLGLSVDVFNIFGSYRLQMSQDPGGYIYTDGTFERWPTYGNVLSAEGSRVVKLTVRYLFGR
jgi:outer membrane receptor protein involved in Fe transport